MNVLMPQLGETVSEGTIAAWHKKAGDVVEKGDMLLDVETDKVATEITAPGSGMLSDILIGEGETVDVGTILAVISIEGEVVEAVPDGPTEVKAQSASLDTTGAGLPVKSGDGKISPAVRRLLKQHDLDIKSIPGSGRDGRVTRQDVLDYIDGSPSSTASDSEAKRIPFDRVRKLTAEHMVRSKATSPHVLQAIDVDFYAVDQSRLAKRESWKSKNGYSLTYLPYVARAVCLALANFPRINASVDNDSLVLHPEINLAIAIDLSHEGLVAAVAKNAAGLSVSRLAKDFNDLVTRAKTNKLTPDDVRGGTYTLSNPGPFGTLFTAPIINQPQVAILSMDAVKKRPHVVESDAGDSIDIRPIGVLAQSFDHRAIDGAYSAAYLQQLKMILETSDWDSEF